MKKYLLSFCLLLVSAPVFAQSTPQVTPQDTATVSLPVGKPMLPSYFMPLYNSMITKPIKLDFSIDPLLSDKPYDDVRTQRNLLTVHSMAQEVLDRLQAEQRQMQVNAGLSTVVGLFFWGALIEENIRGYINYQNEQRNQPPAPTPAANRPPELRRPK